MSRLLELQTVFEYYVLAKGEGEVHLHPLAQHPDIHPLEILQGHFDDVGLIAPEDTEEHKDFAVSEEAYIAPLRRSAGVLPPDLVMVWSVLNCLWQLWQWVS